MYCKYILAHKLLGFLSEPQLETYKPFESKETITFSYDYLLKKANTKEDKVKQALAILHQLKFIDIDHIDDTMKIVASSSGVSAYCECYFIEKANTTTFQKFHRTITYITLPLSVLASILVTIDKCKSNVVRSTPPQTQLEYRVPQLPISK